MTRCADGKGSSVAKRRAGVVAAWQLFGVSLALWIADASPADPLSPLISRALCKALLPGSASDELVCLVPGC